MYTTVAGQRSDGSLYLGLAFTSTWMASGQRTSHLLASIVYTTHLIREGHINPRYPLAWLLFDLAYC